MDVFLFTKPVVRSCFILIIRRTFLIQNFVMALKMVLPITSDSNMKLIYIFFAAK